MQATSCTVQTPEIVIQQHWQQREAVRSQRNENSVARIDRDCYRAQSTQYREAKTPARVMQRKMHGKINMKNQLHATPVKESGMLKADISL